MEQKHKAKLFAKFLAGISSNDEENELLNTSEVKSLMQKQWDSFDDASEQFPKPDNQKILTAIYRRLALGTKSNRERPTVIKLSVQRFYAAAAIGLMLIAMSGIFWFTGVIPGRNLVTITAQDGVRAEVFLPDGSRVWLNPGASIRYKKQFDERERELTLTGDAVFNVSYNTDRPFHVVTKNATINVLGTRFIVKTSPNKTWETTLLSGSVSILPSKGNSVDKLFLKPGQKATWDQANQSFSVNSVNTNDFSLGFANQLRFDNTPLATLAKTLEETFGVRIVVPQQLANQYRFTATFTDESIYEIFNLLKISAPIDFKIVDNTVIVSQRAAK
ncbi:MAG TPA: FecR family protein [Tenuifilaceae bacterium]|nr:FecR family protein [Tenuifilaceae bacterium]